MGAKDGLSSAARFQDSPHQPRRFTFPKRSCGHKQPIRRSFQPCWFNTWTWLHYDEGNDTVLCYFCGKANQDSLLRANCKDAAFVYKGFCNWKDATNCFRRHE